MLGCRRAILISRAGLLSLGKPGLINDLFRQAGFTAVATTKVVAPFRLPSVADYLDFIRTSAGPILQILSRLDGGARDAAWAEIEAKLSAFNTPSGWEGPNELLLTFASGSGWLINGMMVREITFHSSLKRSGTTG